MAAAAAGVVCMIYSRVCMFAFVYAERVRPIWQQDLFLHKFVFNQHATAAAPYHTPSLGNEKKAPLFVLGTDGRSGDGAYQSEIYTYIYLFGKSFVTLRYLSVRAFV